MYQEDIMKHEPTNEPLYIKDIFKTQKILVVMPWCHENDTQYLDEKISAKYINKSSHPGRIGCVKTAVEYYGIELTIVHN